LLNQWLESFQVLYLFWMIIFAATNLAVSIIVYRDARLNRRPALGMTPVMWWAVAFSVPVIGMFVYWLMNHSTLNRNIKP